MPWWMAILLGIVQGVTEFLPVSSSGHLALFQSIGLVEDVHQRHMFFDVLMHMGTLVAVCVVYKKDLVEMFHAVLDLIRPGRRGNHNVDAPQDSSKMRLALMLVIGTLPLVLVLPFRRAIEELGNRMWFVGLMLLVTGGFLYYSDRLVQGKRTETTMSVKNALTIGLLQGTIGTLPGISRSGITITGGMMGGLDRAFAVRFSFLLSIPAILGANIVVLFTSISDVDWSLLPRYLVGTVVAGITGFFAIKLVRVLVRKGSFGKFAYWCWTVGIIALIVSLVQAIIN